ncbi:hypothetical protein QR680_003621 [Steinernema hermaphroditum]|uniref:RING-type domain-containing protein n=1 Tax=Steinernema hermaphroditum TaxID=289476 RepID=A0AA39HN80_9BILA|nr:hypothetical protein QR680_003621 [Steinernema hermaphroditum]
MSTISRFTCPICLDWLDDSQPIIATNCGHVFHHHCLGWALARNGDCPCCREYVFDTTKLYFSAAPYNRTDLQEANDKAYETIEKVLQERRLLQEEVEVVMTRAKELREIQEIEHENLKNYFARVEEQYRSYSRTLEAELSGSQGICQGLIHSQGILLARLQELEAMVPNETQLSTAAKNIPDETSATEGHSRSDEHAQNCGNPEDDEQIERIRRLWNLRHDN